MYRQLLQAHRRMRCCLVAILDLDPPGVSRRIAEMDLEIARLSAMIGEGVPAGDGGGDRTARADVRAA